MLLITFNPIKRGVVFASKYLKCKEHFPTFFLTPEQHISTLLPASYPLNTSIKPTCMLFDSWYIISGNTLRSLKRKEEIASSLIATRISDLAYSCLFNPEMIHWYFASCFYISKHLICSFLSVFYLLIHHAYRVFWFYNL